MPGKNGTKKGPRATHCRVTRGPFSGKDALVRMSQAQSMLRRIDMISADFVLAYLFILNGLCDQQHRIHFSFVDFIEAAYRFVNNQDAKPQTRFACNLHSVVKCTSPADYFKSGTKKSGTY